MNNQETKIANKMFELSKGEEERQEIQWCIDQVDADKKTFLEAVEWCGLDSEYYRAKKEVEGGTK